MPSPYNNQVTIGYESLLDANGNSPNYFAAGLYWGVTDLTCVTPPPVTCTCGPGSPWSTTVTAPAR